jgi:hypothetical protein
MEENKITATEYFVTLKAKKENIDDEKLDAFYNQCLSLVKKYKITGQKEALKRLIFYIDCVEKERKAIANGFTKYIQREDVSEYIDIVGDRVVKVIELERFERDIPDDVVEKIAIAKDIFDELYVIYTDYTGKDEKKVEKQRREKDPIVIGIFLDKKNRVINNRFYFIVDWVDEYCDLTLDRMIVEMKSNSKDMSVYEAVTPETLKEIKDDLSPKNIIKIGEWTYSDNITNTTTTTN